MAAEGSTTSNDGNKGSKQGPSGVSRSGLAEKGGGQNKQQDKQSRSDSDTGAHRYPTPPMETFPIFEPPKNLNLMDQSHLDANNVAHYPVFDGSEAGDHETPDSLPALTPVLEGEPANRPRANSTGSTGSDIGENGITKGHARRISQPHSAKRSDGNTETTGTRKLSASQVQALTASPDSLPVARIATPVQHIPLRKPSGAEYPLSAGVVDQQLQSHMNALLQAPTPLDSILSAPHTGIPGEIPRMAGRGDLRRPGQSRTVSTPPVDRRPSPGPSMSLPPNNRRNSFNPLPRPPPLNLGINSNHLPPPATSAPQGTNGTQRPEKQERSDAPAETPQSSKIVPGLPMPPMSLPTHLQLELAAQRPSPLYIYGAQYADTPYESSAVKFERLMNAIHLFPKLESMLLFGVLACLDAWLYTFTILPMRFVIAIWVLVQWWAYVVWKEVCWVIGFVWQGIGRMWRRGRVRGRAQTTGGEGMQRSYSAASSRASSRAPSRATSRAPSRTRGSDTNHTATARPHNGSATFNNTPVEANASGNTSDTPRLNGTRIFHPPKHALPNRANNNTQSRHRRTKSLPSNLNSFHKADLLQGLIIICSSIALMDLDASRMYHFIRGQSSMKLYVIYNILEVGDRLLSAVGQDFFECLFSSETLSRNSFGRSKLLLPFCMFAITLIYNIVHVLCLFYQVITLNVAVNSYSNSLLTLLISNQFVEIKGAVFKKIEKENLFQLTCADVVERFQLWIILLIIAMRNIVELGGFYIPSMPTPDMESTKAGPLHTSSVIPASFTMLPTWLLSGDVVSPFLVVIGIEIAVDFIKHAYINKFNNIRPALYSRFLDVLAKDYYTNAFSAPSVIRRIGLPLIPLSCLFIRASLQVYNMFLMTHLPPPSPLASQSPSSTTASLDLSVEGSTPSSPAMTAALEQLDTLIRNALGRTVYGDGSGAPNGAGRPFWTFTSDDVIALVTKVVFFFLAWVVLLLLKLVLGMILLRFSRARYSDILKRERLVRDGKLEPEKFGQVGVRRIGGWGGVELGEERRAVIYEGDTEGGERMRKRERGMDEKLMGGGGKDGKGVDGGDGLEKVVRYEMGPSKRIW